MTTFNTYLTDKIIATKPVMAIDFETTYEKTRDIKTLGVQPYLQHKDTKIFLVSAYARDCQYVGRVEDANFLQWTQNYHFVSHNRTFDLYAFLVAQQRNQIDASCALPVWHCTADMCAHFQIERNLKNAAKHILGVDLDKSTRDEFKGMNEEEYIKILPKIRDYALLDAKICFELWEALGACFPEHEKKLSLHTTLLCNVRGVGFDSKKAQKDKENLQNVIDNAESCIPWMQAKEKKISPLMALPGLELFAPVEKIKKSDIATVGSKKFLKKECEKLGIPAPTSTAKNSPEFAEWVDKYRDRATWIDNLAVFRSASRVKNVIEAMENRFINGRMCHGLKYCGAPHTHRWSSTDGVNLQNLPRKDTHGADIRGLLIPEKGKKFITADLSQIEARVLLWLAGDEKKLNLIRNGNELYEAHARATGRYNKLEPLKKGDPDLRTMIKAEYLGCGYGMGASTLRSTCRSIMQINISENEAQNIVDKYRSTNIEVVNLWHDVEETVKRIANRNANRLRQNPDLAETDLEDCYLSVRGIQRPICYYAPRLDGNQIVLRYNLGGPLLHWWYGVGVENLCQSVARDVLGNAILNLESQSIKIIYHVHDEIICEVDEKELDSAKNAIAIAMSTPPSWCCDLPLGSDIHVIDRYKK